MKLTIDFESRSKCDLKACGPQVYAEHPSTEIMCLAIKKDQEQTRLWVPDKFLKPLSNFEFKSVFGLQHEQYISEEVLMLLLITADTIEAHNTSFEKCMWTEICVKRYGWPEIPEFKWRDSAAKAAMHSLPRSLAGVSSALNLNIQKDDKGHRLMLQLCKPRKARKAEKEADPDWMNKTFWFEEPEKLVKLFKYCIRDVDTEHAVSEALDDLPPQEQKLWFIDQRINRRGMYIDTETCEAAFDMMASHRASMATELPLITEGHVERTGQRDKILNWLRTKGLDLPTLTKDVVAAALDRSDIDATARRVLEIRQMFGKASVKKFKAYVDRTGANHRLRYSLVYHGAGTGRWAGTGIQPHNMLRAAAEAIEELIPVIHMRRPALMQLLYGDVMTALASCLRGMIMASPGCDLICADFKSIEGRVLAWVSGEEGILQGYIDGKGMYKIAASGAFGVPYDSVDKALRQIGKVIELACGYQGGWRAFMSMATGYDVQPPQEFIDKYGDIEKAFKNWATPFINRWRENRPMTVGLWHSVEEVVKYVIKTGKPVTDNYVTWRLHKGFLCCDLPSGRTLYYYGPQIKSKMMPWGKPKETITYMGVHSTTKKWLRIYTYGGKLVENIVQAIARDFMSEAIIRVEEAGYPVVLHVHDEIVSEIKEGTGDLKHFENLMAVVPDWAIGCPIEMEGWRGKRYRK